MSSELHDDLAQALDPVLFGRRSLAFDPDVWQARALRWQGRQLILNCSRQAGKSTTAAVRALHEGIYRPDSLILMVSPSLRQSSELFRKVLDLMDRLPARPPLIEDNRLSLKFVNGSRIVSLPGSEGTIRGYSAATLVIEDEASRVPDDLYAAIRPMLAVSNGRLVLMSTPFGRRGHFFETWESIEPTWERIKITVDECPRISPEFIAEERRTMPDRVFRQEYLGDFTETDDQVFSHDLVMSAVTDDVKPLELGGKSHV